MNTRQLVAVKLEKTPEEIKGVKLFDLVSELISTDKSILNAAKLNVEEHEEVLASVASILEDCFDEAQDVESVTDLAEKVRSLVKNAPKPGSFGWAMNQLKSGVRVRLGSSIFYRVGGPGQCFTWEMMDSELWEVVE